jgi:hypothetical protein
MLRVIKDKGGGGIDGNSSRLGRGINGLASMQLESIEVGRHCELKICSKGWMSLGNDKKKEKRRKKGKRD